MRQNNILEFVVEIIGDAAGDAAISAHAITGGGSQEELALDIGIGHVNQALEARDVSVGAGLGQIVDRVAAIVALRYERRIEAVGKHAVSAEVDAAVSLELQRLEFVVQRGAVALAAQGSLQVFQEA